MVLDHIDLRVRSLDSARAFYRTWLPLLGLAEGTPEGEPGDVSVGFYSPDHLDSFFDLNEDPAHRPGKSRIAFGAPSRGAVDAAAHAARLAGAVGMEGPELCLEYAPTYYAAFFADPDGNLLEICHRGDRQA